MAQLDPIQKGYHQSPKSARSQNVLTIEQLLKGKDDSSSERHSNTSPSSANSNSPNNSFPSPAKNHHDPEECSTPKKSVLAKVKEKAKKWKHTLSFKKKNENGDDNTPSWGVKMEEDDHHHDNDDEEEEDDDYYEEDPEYLGAPMYESAMAPENYKEKARQYPRANPVVPEEHAAPTCEKHNPEEHAAPSCETHNPAANKTLTEAVSERLAPAYAAFSAATTTIATTVAGFTAGKKTDSSLSLAESEAQYSAVSDFDNSDTESEPKAAATDTSSPQKSDKGISVKEYFINKFEPGENERALSQVLSEAMNPRNSADEDKSMAGKVCAAVTSLLQPEQPSESSTKQTKNTFPISPLSTPKLLRQNSVHCRPLGTTFTPMTNRWMMRKIARGGYFNPTKRTLDSEFRLMLQINEPSFKSVSLPSNFKIS